MNSGSSDKQHTAAGTSRVQAPLDRCAAPGPAERVVSVMIELHI